MHILSAVIFKLWFQDFCCWYIQLHNVNFIKTKVSRVFAVNSIYFVTLLLVCFLYCRAYFSNWSSTGCALVSWIFNFSSHFYIFQLLQKVNIFYAELRKARLGAFHLIMCKHTYVYVSTNKAYCLPYISVFVAASIPGCLILSTCVRSANINK